MRLPEGSAGKGSMEDKKQYELVLCENDPLQLSLIHI